VIRDNKILRAFVWDARSQKIYRGVCCSHLRGKVGKKKKFLTLSVLIYGYLRRVVIIVLLLPIIMDVCIQNTNNRLLCCVLLQYVNLGLG